MVEISSCQQNQRNSLSPYSVISDDILSTCGSGGGISSGGSGGSGGNNTSGGGTNYTSSLVNYVKNLEPCDAATGDLNLFGAFGTARKCYNYHSDTRRVKTKYWNEDLLFYKSIGVKVKHQRKGTFGWRYYDADEVALIINQAMFSVKLPNQIAPYSLNLPTSTNANNRLYYYKGKYYDDTTAYSLLAQGVTPALAQLIPDTPFADDIIIQEYIDLPVLRNINDIKIEAKEINKAFYRGAWNGVRALAQKVGGEPTKITFVVTTPQKIYVNYIDLTDRRLNTDKIVNTLDYDWGGEIKLNISIDGNGGIATDSFNAINPLSYITPFGLPELTEFETLSIDFVGLTRRGSTWKGNRIVVTKDDE